MDEPEPPILHLFCGRIAAGKSTLAGALAAGPRTVLIALDDWMAVLYPTENRSIEDFAILTTRIRAVMGPHVVAMLRNGVSVVLDFPANTLLWRGWMRSIIEEAKVHHELHWLDTPDAVCRERLRRRNESREHRYVVDDATYDRFMRYFVPPTEEEAFNIVVHRP